MRDPLLHLNFSLLLSEPPSEDTRQKAHKWLDTALDLNMTSHTGTFIVDADGNVVDIPSGGYRWIESER